MTTALKSICFVTAAAGFITAGVCIWVMAMPLQLKVVNTVHINWDGKDPPRVGIATAVLMIIVGISACFINLEKKFIFFAVALLLLLILAIAFMSVAIKDHQDWKSLGAFQKSASKARVNSFTNSGYGRSSKDHSAFIVDEDSLSSILTRLKILAAAGGIDMVILLIGVVLFYLKRPKKPSNKTSRNAMQMERTL